MFKMFSVLIYVNVRSNFRFLITCVLLWDVSVLQYFCLLFLQYFCFCDVVIMISEISPFAQVCVTLIPPTALYLDLVL